MSVHPIQPGTLFSSHVTATTWQHRLDVASHADEVVDVARDFLATLSPYELHALPEACRPPQKIFEDDISTYAFELTTHECNTAEPGELVYKLARFFSHAATRLATLSALDLRRRGDGDLDQQQSA